ncbi:MAG: twin-arginine translocation signal domain-containing protein, partial [Gordonibacter sp.]|uniref:twin-arginine translocation signal domain-containing protein n=1 Tax=Gordonibacter sp. TaxID=1968902 RepID=UPI002FCC9AA8
MSELKIPNQGISRRSFLKTSAAVAGAAAVGGGTMTALAADETTDSTVEEHDVVCVCGCNCQGNCSLVATVREGRVVNVRSNDDLPYPAYERICNRGFAHPQRLYDFNRVTYPMKRKTWSMEKP